MRVRTPAVLIAAVAAAAMLLAGCTPPLADDFEYPLATVGAQGASIDVIVTFTCQRGLNIAFGSAHIAQAHDGRLAQGDGAFAKAFPGTPCTGHVQGGRMTVFNSSPWTFTSGKAVVDAAVTLFDENSGDLPEVDSPPREIQVSPAASGSQPAQTSRPTLDPRFSS